MALLLGHLLGHLSRDVLARLFFASLEWNLLFHLGTLLPGDIVALFTWNLLALFLWNILADLLGHLFGDLLGDLFTLFLWHLLGLLSGDLSALLFGFLVADLLGDVLALLFWHLTRNISALLFGDILTLLPWYIPTFLFRYILTLLFGNLHQCDMKVKNVRSKYKLNIKTILLPACTAVVVPHIQKELHIHIEAGPAHKLLHM